MCYGLVTVFESKVTLAVDVSKLPVMLAAVPTAMPAAPEVSNMFPRKVEFAAIVAPPCTLQ